jgi:hypothetical protein
MELKNLNACSENPFAHFEESLRTITSFHAQAKSITGQKKIPVGFQTAQQK